MAKVKAVKELEERMTAVMANVRAFLEGEMNQDELDEALDDLAHEAEYASIMQDDINYYYSGLTT